MLDQPKGFNFLRCTPLLSDILHIRYPLHSKLFEEKLLYEIETNQNDVPIVSSPLISQVIYIPTFTHDFHPSIACTVGFSANITSFSYKY